MEVNRREEKHREYEKLRQQLEGKNTMMVVNVMDPRMAIEDDRFREGVLEFLHFAWLDSRKPKSEDEGRLQCFCCCRNWTRRLAPIAILTTEFLNGIDAGLVAGICRECYGDHALLMRSIKRDFNIEEVQWISASGTA